MGAEDRVNILLVDDQQGKLLTYKAILEELGENLVAATSGREALEHLLKSDFAVILVDVCMPEQDGFELVETIRSHHRFSKTAIIFVSAIQMDDIDRIRGYASGAVDYVSVPIVPELLRAKVRVFVDLYRKTRQLEQMNVELEARVTERTAKLTEIQAKLEEADRRKNMFLATLAHELRNPLAPMRSSLDILNMEEQKSPTTNLAAEVIERQLSQLTRLVDDLMDLGRITRNNIELRIFPADLAEIARGALEVASVGIQAAGHKLTTKLPEENYSIDVDAARFSQVISNLLNNAAKFTPDGGEISLQIEIDGPDLVIRVRDSGIGIRPEDLPLLFEPFYQFGRQDDRPNSGLGIGLTLVKTIVEMHGGTVTATSAGPGAGSEFVVRAPCAARKSRDVLNDATAVASAGRSSASRRVLVADDNDDAARILGMLLEQLGNEVELAHDGEEAVERAEELRPDLILLDIGMPRMSGHEAVRVIRSREWGREPVIVAVTGWGQDEDRRMSAESGFDYHFVKPVGMSALKEVIGEMDRKTNPAAEE